MSETPFRKLPPADTPSPSPPRVPLHVVAAVFVERVTNVVRVVEILGDGLHDLAQFEFLEPPRRNRADAFERPANLTCDCAG